MTEVYDPIYVEMRDLADELLGQYRQVVATLTQSTPGAPDPETPWIPGAPETRTYKLYATTRKVEQRFVDGTEILISDGQLNARTMMTLTAINGVAQSPTTEVRAVPQPGDALTVEGKGRTLLRVEPGPGPGTVVVWHLIYRG